MEDFNQIYKLHYNMVYTVINRIVRDSFVAEDLTQEAFLKAWININNFKGECKLSTWIAKIGVNAAINYYRNKKKRSNYEFEYFEDKAGESFNNCLEMVIIEEQIARLKSELPAFVFEVLMLQTIEGLSYAEICQRVNMGRTSVYRALWLGRHFLKE
jgi:RNA polymerase sigma factor (sigma-70 family)